MGFASKCSILKLSDGGAVNSNLKIFDIQLISLDHVTYATTKNHWERHVLSINHNAIAFQYTQIHQKTYTKKLVKQYCSIPALGILKIQLGILKKIFLGSIYIINSIFFSTTTIFVTRYFLLCF